MDTASFKPELGQRYEQAVTKHAHAKSAASAAKKLAARVYAQCLIAAEDAPVELQKAAARIHPKYIAAEDEWQRLETAANLANAECDALRLKYESWRSMNATKRAEMQIR